MRAEQPAVELIGHTLYFGGIDIVDGGGERLDITAIGRTGFESMWRCDGGIEVTIDTASERRLQDPGGPFCPVRQGGAQIARTWRVPANAAHKRGGARVLLNYEPL